MTHDAARVRFIGKAIVAAHAVGGSIDGTESKPFTERLYSDWKSLNQDIEEAPYWLATQMTSAFRSVGAPPAWVEEEPSWPFSQGEPMTFISQAKVGELSPGEVVYVFAARRLRGTGFSMVYRVVSQFSADRNR